MEFKWIHYNYSMKNIPIPSEKLYKTTLINKVEPLIKRLRWKAHLTDSNYIGHTNHLLHIFKSRKCPPQHKELIDFEIAERVDCLLMTDAFITLKDHKPNFTTNPKCRLINPLNNELGKVSKFLIGKANTIIRDKSLVNQ